MNILSNYAGKLADLGQLYVIIGIAVSVILAFFAFKLMRIELIALGAFVGYQIGATTLAPIFNISNGEMIFGIVCAVVGAIIALSAYKLTIFICAGVGAYIGALAILPSLNLGLEGTILTVVAVVVAIVCAFIVLKLFKLLLIIATSLGGMIFASTLVFNLIGVTSPIVAIIVGALLGLLALRAQYKMAK